MPFQIPKIDDIKSKTISLNTWKIYRTHLNKLFKAGYTSPDALLMNQQAIIDLIEETIPGNTPDEKTKKRLWMSSIRWALADTPPSKQTIFNEYYPKTFNDPAPGTILKDGTKWVARDEFKKQESKTSQVFDEIRYQELKTFMKKYDLDYELMQDINSGLLTIFPNLEDRDKYLLDQGAFVVSQKDLDILKSKNPPAPAPASPPAKRVLKLKKK